MKQFEIPYTFQHHHLEHLEESIPGFKSMVHSLYMPAFIDHSVSTRMDTGNVVKQLPKTLYDYEREINYVKSKGYTVNILFQDTEKVMTEEILSFYIDKLEIEMFTVYKDETARLIRKMKPEATIIASIVKQLTVEQLQSDDLDVYDYIVLDFRFNRHFDVIKELSDRHKYVLIPNTFCQEKTPKEVCALHWRNKLPASHICDSDSSCFLHVWELHEMDDYIAFYKLQGRECASDDERYYNKIIPYMTHYYND